MERVRPRVHVFRAHAHICARHFYVSLGARVATMVVAATVVAAATMVVAAGRRPRKTRLEARPHSVLVAFFWHLAAFCPASRHAVCLDVPAPVQQPDMEGVLPGALSLARSLESSRGSSPGFSPGTSPGPFPGGSPPRTSPGFSPNPRRGLHPGPLPGFLRVLAGISVWVLAGVLTGAGWSGLVPCMNLLDLYDFELVLSIL